ncbi:adenosylcobalamin-dependent ribonucleoside-diphosphate reductase [Candidatus Woesearchaeota archaeon]|nr:adenosylcobalamin-dependent ribonucleoside-diphosphate reductase [Candidatus Woesearchaeota archaeon]
MKKKVMLSKVALDILKARYLRKNEKQQIVESPEQMFHRVASIIASVEKQYNADTADIEKLAQEFYEIMADFDFLPNSPTLMNADTPIGQLAACFVLPIEDSLDSIYETLKLSAKVHQSGGGTGFSFSKLRPKGDLVKSTMSEASGPISFMKEFDVATEVIKQGGRRRGAMMATLGVDHPDILEFIKAKEKEDVFTNFNLSVLATNSFMEAVINNKDYSMINPRTGKKQRPVAAKKIFDEICKSAWRTGDPGLIFIDEINKKNPTPKAGKIEATNPCGEVPLLPFESCILGSINLDKMLLSREEELKDAKGKKMKTFPKEEIDWNKLAKTVHKAVHFLDNVIDINRYPDPKIEKATKANRKIGLGIMGWAEFLIRLGIKYDSEEALKLAEKLMKFIHKEAVKRSQEIARKKGSFPNFAKSTWKKKVSKLRNATLTTIAPTGTISLIAGCSSGIEPLFSIAYERQIMDKEILLVNPLFEHIARQRGFYSNHLMNKIKSLISVQGVKEIPKDVRDLFITAFDIKPEMHVKMQAAFQKYTDNAVSKTVNLNPTATVGEVRNIYLLAYQLKCKGITIFRLGSKKEQVMSL